MGAQHRRKHRRSQELVKENFVSQAEVEAAEVEVDLRAADLKQATAQLQAADVDLANTTIRAPIDGVVIARSIDVGQTVAASLQAPKLFVIANDLAQMQVETRIDEADIGRIAAGLPVTFTVDAYPEMSFRGAVTQVRLEPIVEQGVVTYTTVIRTQNRDLKLRPGMTANVTVLVAEQDHRILGYAYAGIEPLSWKDLRDECGFLHDLVVAPGDRGQGVADALLNEVVWWVRARGQRRIVLCTAERNAAAQRLFARRGFRRTMIEMTLEVGCHL